MRKLIYVLFYLLLISCEKNKQSIVLHENNIEQNNTVSENNELSVYTGITPKDVYREITPKTMYVNSKEGLRKRSYPSLSSNVLGTLLYGEKIVINKVTKDAESIDGITDYWYGIENNNDTWVFGGYLSDEILPNDSPFLIFGAWENKKQEREVILFKSNYQYSHFYKESSDCIGGTYELYDNKIILYIAQMINSEDVIIAYDETVEVNYIIIDNNNIVLEFPKARNFRGDKTKRYKRIYDEWEF
jgi:hypothetical protein